MISAIIIGRKGSKGFKGKNTTNIFGKPMFYYPLEQALKSKYISKIFLATDCEIMKKKSRKFIKRGLELINRPDHLNDDKALGDDVFKYCHDFVTKKYGNQNLNVLLFANAPMITHKMIDKGITFLKKNKKFDSIVSVSRYNMWSPLSARKLSKNGNLVPFVPFKHFAKGKKIQDLNCDRDSQGDVYFADMSLSVVRSKCFKNMRNNLLPQKWMGKKIAPLFSWGGADIDYPWQLPQAKFWIKNNS